MGWALSRCHLQHKNVLWSLQGNMDRSCTGFHCQLASFQGTLKLYSLHLFSIFRKFGDHLRNREQQIGMISIVEFADGYCPQEWRYFLRLSVTSFSVKMTFFWKWSCMQLVSACFICHCHLPQKQVYKVYLQKTKNCKYAANSSLLYCPGLFAQQHMHGSKV